MSLLVEIDAVVIGGSWGAFQVLTGIVAVLRADTPVPIAVVIHQPPDRPGRFCEALRGRAAVRIKEAEDKEALAAGTLYLAPPDYHLLIEQERAFALAADEPVHFSRPAIDVLFESAADVYGARLLGVLLSGASADGAAGVRAIQRAGGRVVVQDPASAEAPIMPRAGMEACRPDLVANAEAIAALFAGFEPGGETTPPGEPHG